MKTTLKRTLSLVLTVCMLLSVLPTFASALEIGETYTFDFSTVQTLAGVTSGSNVSGSYPWYPSGQNWGILAKQDTNPKADNSTDSVGIRFVWKKVGAYMALHLKGIDAGVYQMDLVSARQLSGSGSGTADVYVLPYTNWESNFTAGTGKLSTQFVRNQPTTIENVAFAGDPNNEYVVIFKNPSETAYSSNMTLGIKTITLTKTDEATVVYAMLNGTTELTSEAEVIAALSTSGNTVKLMQNVDLGNEANLNSGAIVDLNGKTLSGDSAALVTVSGSGSVAVAPMNVADGYVAVKDGDVYDIVSCTIKVADSETEGSNVKFWFRVELGDTAAYALAAADTDFVIGAMVSVNGGTAVKAAFDKSWDLYSDWSTAMQTDDGTTAFCITILNAADYEIDLTPVIDTVTGVTI